MSLVTQLYQHIVTMTLVTSDTTATSLGNESYDKQDVYIYSLQIYIFFFK